MKRIIFSAGVLFLSLASFAQQFSADKIVGTWLNDGGDVGLKFEIYASEGKYFGKLIWASTM